MPPREFNIAVDEKGTPLPYSSIEVRKHLNKMLDEGSIVMVVLRGKDDELGIQVFGPPSKEMLDILDTTARAYRNVLKGQ